MYLLVRCHCLKLTHVSKLLPIERHSGISLCTDIGHEKKNCGFTANLGFNPVFTKFNLTEFLHATTPESMQHIKGKEN